MGISITAILTSESAQYDDANGSARACARTRACTRARACARERTRARVHARERPRARAHARDHTHAHHPALLGDLINKVLNPAERQLIQALALYRKEIPHDHADWLRVGLGYQANEDAEQAEFASNTPADKVTQAQHLHVVVATCWLKQLGGARCWNIG